MYFFITGFCNTFRCTPAFIVWCTLIILFVDGGSSVDDFVIVGGVGITVLVLIVIIGIMVLCIIKLVLINTVH